MQARGPQPSRPAGRASASAPRTTGRDAALPPRRAALGRPPRAAAVQECCVMSFRAWFRCVAGCPGEYPLDRPLYRCPACHDLLEVAHDLDRLRDRSPAAWMRLFDDRYKRTTWPYGSAVWGKKEWVAPHVRDENIVSMDEGGTNLFWADRFGRQLGLDDLWVKMCGNDAHRVVQGPGHDGARLDRAADDRRRTPASAPSPAPRRATRRPRWPPTAPRPASRPSSSCRVARSRPRS